MHQKIWGSDRGPEFYRHIWPTLREAKKSDAQMFWPRSVQLAKHQRVLSKFIRFSSVLWALIEIRILHPVLCKPLEFELFVLTSSRPTDTPMGMLNAHLSGKVYDECLETVETITETINYPLVRKEARASRLLIKSWLIVLHIHCLKSAACSV